MNKPLSSNASRGSRNADTPALQSREAVWQVIHQIPAGCVASYGQIAALAGYPGAARWVGSILRALPEDSPLPWQRVVRADGSLALPADSGGDYKQKNRLLYERINFVGERVDMRRHQWRP